MPIKKMSIIYSGSLCQILLQVELKKIYLLGSNCPYVFVLLHDFLP